MIEIEEPKKIKILILGEKEVGKTYIIKKFISRDWELKNFSLIKKTKGLEINVEIYKIENEEILFEFVEFEGDFEKRDSLDVFLNIYLKEKTLFNIVTPFHAVVFVFDCNNFRTLQNSLNWFKWFYNQIRMKIFFDENNNFKEDNQRDVLENLLKIPILFLGNKIDFKNNINLNVISIDMNNRLNSIKEFVLSNFAFQDSKNVFFFEDSKRKEFFDFFEDFLMQIFFLIKNENQKFCNINAEDKIEFQNYPLKEFMYLKTLNYKINKNYIQKIALFLKKKLINN